MHTTNLVEDIGFGGAGGEAPCGADPNAGRGRMTSLVCDSPATDTEATLEKVLADLVGVERVRVDSHFFDELGADSMLMARFCARARKQPNVPSVSMKDIYRNPTIRGLAQALDAALPGAFPGPASASESVETPVPTPTEAAAPP